MISCDPHLGQDSRDPPTDLQAVHTMWLSSHPYSGVEEAVVPQTAQTKKDAGTGEGLTDVGLDGLGEKLISLTGDSGSYSFSVKSGQGLDILSARLVVGLDSSTMAARYFSGHEEA